MENKQSLNTEVIKNSNRTFYLNVKQSVKGNNYLVITQAQKDSEGQVDRHSIVLFESEVAQFAAAMTRSLLMFNTSQKKTSKTDKQLEIAAYKEAVKKSHPNAYKKWSNSEDILIREFFEKGATVAELMVTLQRNEAGILARLNKLGLMNEQELENLVSEPKV